MSTGAGNQLFTVESLQSMQGLSFATWLISSVLCLFVGKRKLLVTLGVALVLSVLATTMGEDRRWQLYVVAIINGFLIFFMAIGGNKVLARGWSASKKRKLRKGDGTRFQGSSPSLPHASILDRLLSEW